MDLAALYGYLYYGFGDLANRNTPQVLLNVLRDGKEEPRFNNTKSILGWGHASLIMSCFPRV